MSGKAKKNSTNKQTSKLVGKEQAKGRVNAYCEAGKIHCLQCKSGYDKDIGHFKLCLIVLNFVSKFERCPTPTKASSGTHDYVHQPTPAEILEIFVTHNEEYNWSKKLKCYKIFVEEQRDAMHEGIATPHEVAKKIDQYATAMLAKNTDFEF